MLARSHTSSPIKSAQGRHHLESSHFLFPYPVFLSPHWPYTLPSEPRVRDKIEDTINRNTIKWKIIIEKRKWLQWATIISRNLTRSRMMEKWQRATKDGNLSPELFPTFPALRVRAKILNPLLLWSKAHTWPKFQATFFLFSFSSFVLTWREVPPTEPVSAHSFLITLFCISQA